MCANWETVHRMNAWVEVDGHLVDGSGGVPPVIGGNPPCCGGGSGSGLPGNPGTISKSFNGCANYPPHGYSIHDIDWSSIPSTSYYHVVAISGSLFFALDTPSSCVDDIWVDETVTVYVSACNQNGCGPSSGTILVHYAWSCDPIWWASKCERDAGRFWL